MDKKAIYLGTDASKRWTKAEFYEFCKPYFDKGKAWTFIPHKRTIYFNSAGNIAWFEENLDTWMGICRGTGVLEYNKNKWKIVHYNLTVTIPNTVIKDYIKLLEE